MQKIKAYRITGSVALTLALYLPGSTLPHSGIGPTSDGRLDSMVNKSRLIFLGKVLKTNYRVETSTAKERVPVTYVTYRIDKVLRGKPTARTLTMRFAGGTDGMGHFLTISNTPRFMTGEQDLLFVRGNGSIGCPLVNCQDGRLRVFKGGTYNAHGVPVRGITKEGFVSRGRPLKVFTEFKYPAPSFEALMKNPEARDRLKAMGMPISRARKLYQAKAPRTISVRTVVPDKSISILAEQKANRGKGSGAIRATSPPLQKGPVSIEVTMKAIAITSRRAGGRPKPVRSIDPMRPPRLSAASIATPAKPKVNKIPGQPRSRELEKLRANRGNPVIRKNRP